MQILRRLAGSFCLSIFLTISVFAQTGASVSGTVQDSRAPLAGTQVVLTSGSGEKISVQTDADGRYIFENVAAGSYEIAVLAADGSSLVTRKINVEPNQNLKVDLSVATRLGEVLVVASGTDQPIEEISKSVSVIEGQEMRDRADFSLVESLRTVPGLRVQQLGGFGKTANIKIRGLRNQDTAILLDGVRFRDPSAITGDASAFLSDLTLTSVSRLEILRGSGSSVYGTNAVGGVVDFRTPTPRAGWHGQVSGVGGVYGLGRFRGNVSRGSDKFGFNAGVSRTVYADGVDGDDRAENTNFQTRVEFNPSAKTNISARIFFGDSLVKLNSSPDTIGTLPGSNAQIIDAEPLSISELERYADGTFPSALNAGNVNFIPDTNDPDAFQKSRFFSGQAALTQILADELVWRTTYQYLRTRRRNENGVLGVGFQPFGGAETSIYAGEIHTLNSRIDWTLGRNNILTAGYEFESENFTNEGLTPFASGNFDLRARQSSQTVFVQDQANFFDRRLQISGSVRAQFFSLKTPEFSNQNAPYQDLALENPPSAYTADGSVAYFFRRSGTKIRAHVGNGYRVPSLYERFGTYYDTFSQPNGFVALGDPFLEPERSVGFDLGLDQNLFKDRARLSATYFYTRLKNTIGYENVVTNVGGSPRFAGGYVNVPGGVSRGGEFSAEIKPSSATFITASYTYTNSDQRVPQVSGSGVRQTLGVPDHQFSFVVTQRFLKRFSANFDFSATSKYLAPIFSNTTFRTYIYRFDGARRGDVTVSYEIPAYGEKLRFRIFATVENVFDSEYYENGFRTVGRNGRVGAAMSF